MKIIKIEFCADCPCRLAYKKEDDSNGCYCNKKDKEIKDSYSIPGWCPLEDYDSLKKR